MKTPGLEEQAAHLVVEPKYQVPQKAFRPLVVKANVAFLTFQLKISRNKGPLTNHGFSQFCCQRSSTKAFRFSKTLFGFPEPQKWPTMKGVFV